MKRVLFICFMLTAVFNITAQDKITSAGSKFTIGTELDLLPFVTGGYYGSIIFEYGSFRIRPVYAKAFQPEFVLPDGFDENKMNVFAFLIDYKFNEQQYENTFWVGAGAELWHNRVRTKDKVEKSFNTYVITLGGGYLWFLTKHIYLNPWFAGHLTAGGETEIMVGSSKYESKLFLPEVSLKIGFIL